MPKVATSSARSEFHPRALACTGSGTLAHDWTGAGDKDHTSYLKSLLSLPGVVYQSLETDTILLQDDQYEALFAIVSDGIVGLAHVLDDGRRSISHLFLPGDIIDFRYCDKVSGKAVCLSPSQLAMVSAEAFTNLGDNEQRIHEVLGNSLLKHWGFATRHCSDLARKSAIEKLASYIFECRKRYPGKVDKNNGGAVHLALRRIDISDYLGLRPETLCRAFAKLKQGHIIEFNNVSHVNILNEDALRKIADGKQTGRIESA